MGDLGTEVVHIGLVAMMGNASANLFVEVSIVNDYLRIALCLRAVFFQITESFKKIAMSSLTDLPDMEIYTNLIVFASARILQERDVYRPSRQITLGVNRGQVVPNSRWNSSRSRCEAVTIRSIRRKAFWL